MGKAYKWWPKGFRVWKDNKPPFKVRCQHRKSGRFVDLSQYPPRTAEFYQECASITEDSKDRQSKSGTFGSLVENYRKSEAFKDLAPRTRSDYQKVLDYLQPLSPAALAKFDSPFIIKIRDKAQSHKGARFGTYVKQVISTIFSWGKERGFVKENPALGIRSLRKKRGKAKANRAWSDEERCIVLSEAPEHMRPALALMMFTGMGPKDALALSKAAVNGSVIRAARSKTGTDLYWPVICQLRAALETAPKHEAETLCATSRGTPWTEAGLRSSWSKLRQRLESEDKVGKGLTLYGLRHTVATILREAGMSDREIAAALGHETEVMARHYAKGADLQRNMEHIASRFEAELNTRGTKTVKL